MVTSLPPLRKSRLRSISFQPGGPTNQRARAFMSEKAAKTRAGLALKWRSRVKLPCVAGAVGEVIPGFLFRHRVGFRRDRHPAGRNDAANWPAGRRSILPPGP